MKVILERNELLKALRRARGVVEKASSLPILSNLLLRVDSNVTISSTDMEIAIVDCLPAARVEAEGAITVPAQMIHDIISKLPEDALPELSVGGNTKEGMSGEPLILRAGPSRFEISTLPARDFAVIDPGITSHSFSVGAVEFVRVLESTRGAVLSNETQRTLSGVLIDVGIEQGEPLLRTVGSDGHRLAISETRDVHLERGFDEGEIQSLILPLKAVNEIIRLIDIKAGHIKIEFSKNILSVHVGECVLTTRLIEGPYPPYRTAIPTQNPYEFEVNRVVLEGAVNRMAVIAFERGSLITLHMNPSGIRITSVNPMAASAEESIEGQYQGPVFDVMINARYLLEALRHITTDKAQLWFRDSKSGIVVTGLSDYMTVMMPLHVQEVDRVEEEVA